jgi:glycosyltransferase involved in cell wall biosynthesis
VYPNGLPWVKEPHPAENIRGGQVLVFSGNFEYHPNIDAVRFLLAEIWPKVRKRHPELRLRLVGRGDRFIRHLLPPESNVEVTGPVPDAFAEIAAADLVVAPLRAGSGTRIKILEAWAAARPVIATPLAAEGLKAEDGVNLALAADGEAFVAAIDRLLSDSCERQHLGQNGRQTFEESYTWEACWQTMDLNLQVKRPVELTRYTG